MREVLNTSVAGFLHRAARPRHVRRLSRRAAGVLREDVEQPRLLEAHEQLHRPVGRSRRERRVVRVHRRQDPAHRRGSGHRREADPERSSLRREAASFRDRLLRGLQQAQRLARRSEADADRAHDARPGSRPPKDCEEFDIVVWATGFDFGTGALAAHGHPRARRPARSRTTGPTARRRSSASRPPASRTSSSPVGRTPPPATTPATTATRWTSSPTRSCTCATRAATPSRSTRRPRSGGRTWSTRNASLGPFGESSYYFGTNIPGKPRRYLLNSGGRPKLFKEIARVLDTDYEAFRLSRSATVAARRSSLPAMRARGVRPRAGPPRLRSVRLFASARCGDPAGRPVPPGSPDRERSELRANRQTVATGVTGEPDRSRAAAAAVR